MTIIPAQMAPQSTERPLAYAFHHPETGLALNLDGFVELLCNAQRLSQGDARKYRLRLPSVQTEAKTTEFIKKILAE